MGHYCRICERQRPNEKFSGKGHNIHVCKDCMRLPKDKRQFIEEWEEIEGFLSQSNISKKNLWRLKTLMASPNSEIARIATLVWEIGKVHPYKRKRLSFLVRERKDLITQLEEKGLISVCESY